MTQKEAEKYAEKMRQLPEVKKTIVVRILEYITVDTELDKNNYDVEVHLNPENNYDY